MATAFQVLVRLLSARERTAAELRARLARKGFSPLAIEATLERGVALGYVDDLRVARAKAERLFAKGVSRALTENKLREAGVTSRILAEVMLEAPADVWLARTALARRFRTKLPPVPLAARYLAGKGFDPDLIETLLS